MRLISVKQAKALLKQMCTNKNKYHEVKLLTAKKDRSITVKNDGEKVTLIEEGYLHLEEKYSLEDISECRRAIQAAFKKEFPRSNQAYLITG